MKEFRKIQVESHVYEVGWTSAFIFAHPVTNCELVTEDRTLILGLQLRITVESLVFFVVNGQLIQKQMAANYMFTPQ